MVVVRSHVSKKALFSVSHLRKGGPRGSNRLARTHMPVSFLCNTNTGIADLGSAPFLSKISLVLLQNVLLDAEKISNRQEAEELEVGGNWKVYVIVEGGIREENI